MATETDPLATLAAETLVHARIDEAEDRWGSDTAALAAAILVDLTATWELDGHGLRRLVLTCPWETDPGADTR
jgi:hypothetical protein